MREYELMVIYSPELDEEALTAQIERTKDLIVGVGGEVEKVDQWGNAGSLTRSRITPKASMW